MARMKRENRKMLKNLLTNFLSSTKYQKKIFASESEASERSSSLICAVGSKKADF